RQAEITARHVREPLDITDVQGLIEAECLGDALPVLGPHLRVELEVGDWAPGYQVCQRKGDDRDAEHQRDDLEHPAHDVLSHDALPNSWRSPHAGLGWARLPEADSGRRPPGDGHPGRAAAPGTQPCL